ncbi:ATP-dependent protease ClpP, protease subunit [Onishia taeanensis]|uniref:ATP-dependent Clp protease proteolytic subunit n=1 Tax=Onishia taeanensis TaxID=284577 RepID=A0A1G7N6L6_9GAMM|nr:head maturation protease, ClpP-related [Halomonas taeanensis]SDF69601.1 ATP-dependent protease ClpP, protease subunit [Halomonas taeanensis]
MTLKTLPTLPAARPRANVQFDLSPRAMQAWNPGIRSAMDDEESTITIYDPIGEDMWGDGVTAKRIAGALRRIGSGNDVTVNINSPGGNYFEGLAIYNLLREHQGRVVVNVMGIAASAASVIAMGSDELRIGRAAFLMVHNAWVGVMGNRLELREVADWLEPFDAAAADLYHVRTGIPQESIVAQLDAETWIGGGEAVTAGWADGLLTADEVEEGGAQASHRLAAKELDLAMAKAGIPRSRRRELMQEFKSGTPSAAGGGTPRATATDTPSAVEHDLEPLPKLEFPGGMSNA